MARIRSVHPSFFTDEAVVSCSALARLVYVGLWTEADDQGLFEWKPLQIKMRLLPGDAADVPALLAELAGAGLIAELESAGKKLGAIRSFRTFQRPKKPNAVFVLPPEWRTYVGLYAAGSEPSSDEVGRVRNQLPTSGEIPPQMEDGGEEVGKDSSVSDETGVAADLGEEGLDPLESLRALPEATGAWRLALKVLTDQGGLAEPAARKFLGRLKSNGLEPAEMWQIAEAAHVSGTPDPQAYLVKAAEGVVLRRSSGALPFGPRIRNPSEAQQRAWAEDWASGDRTWRESDRGPRPGDSGCQVAPAILRQFGIEPAREGAAA